MPKALAKYIRSIIQLTLLISGGPSIKFPIPKSDSFQFEKGTKRFVICKLANQFHHNRAKISTSQAAFERKATRFYNISPAPTKPLQTTYHQRRITTKGSKIKSRDATEKKRERMSRDRKNKNSRLLSKIQ